jgi:uncharacterized protein (TIGR03000 family)
MHKKWFMFAALPALAGTLVLLLPGVSHAQRYRRRGVDVEVGPVGVYVGSGWAYDPYPDEYDWPSYYNESYPQSDMNRTSNYYGAAMNARPAEFTNKALLIVRVPPQAEIWFGNSSTQKKGLIRDFLSPELTPGREYTYSIKAKWMQNGQEMTRTQEVAVHAGADVHVDFLDNQSRAMPSHERLPQPPPSDKRGTQPGSTNPQQDKALPQGGTSDKANPDRAAPDGGGPGSSFPKDTGSK